MAEQDSEQKQVPEAPPVDNNADDFDKERAMATIHKLREFEKAAKTSLKELDDLRAKVKADEEAKLTESEKLQKRLADLEKAIADKDAAISERDAKVRDADRRSLVAKVAAVAGAVDPMDANILIATAEIDPTSPTATKDVEAALASLKTGKPYLFRKAGLEAFNPADGGKGQPISDAQRRARLYGGGGQVLDAAWAMAHGGGVFMSQSPDTPIPKK